MAMNKWTPTTDAKLKAVFFGAGLAILVVIWVGVYAETRDCTAKGGKRLRGGLLEGFKCYDLRTLKELK